MSYFKVGSSSKALSSDDHVVEASLQALEDAKPGQWFAKWNYLIQIDENILKPNALEKLRHRGDDLADQVVKALKLKRGQDALLAIEKYMTSTAETDRDSSVVQFYNEMNSLPPFFALPDRDKPIPSDFKPDEEMHSRQHDHIPTISQGQAVYWRYSAEIAASLLHFSLTVGFSATRITNALDETGYLTSDAREATYRRLMETAQMINDCMLDLRPGEGIGWKSCLRVRLLHAQSRLRIMEKRGRYNRYDHMIDGIVSQRILNTIRPELCFSRLTRKTCWQRLALSV